MALTLTGTEELSIEVSGNLPKDRAMALVGDMPLELVKGHVPVSLLLVQMKGLRAEGLATPGFNYGQALWRIGIKLDNVPAWLGLLCDIDSTLVRKSAGWLIRYPLRTATFHFEGSQARGAVDITANGKRCAVFATPTLAEAPPPEAPRRLVVKSSNALWEVPWAEEPAPFRRVARIAFAAEELAEETFGAAVRFLPEGLLHRGRIHRCGPAKKL